MVAKRILCSYRLRRVPKQFSWVDHRLVRDKHICGLSHRSLALYLFLITVSDADGLSYYSDGSIKRYLNMDGATTALVRAELCTAGLIAYSRPHYQVLSLELHQGKLPAEPCENAPPSSRCKSEPVSFGAILREAIGGTL